MCRLICVFVVRIGRKTGFFMAWLLNDLIPVWISSEKEIIWTASSEFGTYRTCEQSRQNLRCSLIQAVSQEEPSDRKPDPWPLWMAGHVQLKFVMTECSKTQIRLTGLIWKHENHESTRLGFDWVCSGSVRLMQYCSRPLSDLSAVMHIRNKRELAHWSQRTTEYELHYDEILGDFIEPLHSTYMYRQLKWR